jgi:glycerol-3-phosphate acyltransferase PlsX
MKIGLDTMGGDYAPDSTIGGALLAYKEMPATDRIVLIGDEQVIREALVRKKADPEVFDIVHAPEVIGMNEPPSRTFFRKSRSSISVGFSMLGDHAIDAFTGAGSSGAMMVGSIYSVNVIQGVIRPCTAALIPKENSGVGILLDVGTNPDTKPDVLYQFAILGAIYAEAVHKIIDPKIGLLNIGEEDIKGNVLTHSAFQLMKDMRDFRFIGNIEGRDLFNDRADVIVCDGFTGNVIIKLIESMHEIIVRHGRSDDFIDRFNYENYGGTPILGINSSVVVGHGISNAGAIKNMILLAREMHNVGLAGKIKDTLIKFSEINHF